MTDALATKQDLRELEARLDARFAHVEARFAQVDTRLVELEKRMEVRFDEQTARFDGQLAALEHRMTLRLGGMLVAALGAFSALVKLL